MTEHKWISRKCYYKVNFCGKKEPFSNFSVGISDWSVPLSGFSARFLCCFARIISIASESFLLFVESFLNSGIRSSSNSFLASDTGKRLMLKGKIRQE